MQSSGWEHCPSCTKYTALITIWWVVWDKVRHRKRPPTPAALYLKMFGICNSFLPSFFFDSHLWLISYKCSLPFEYTVFLDKVDCIGDRMRVCLGQGPSQERPPPLLPFIWQLFGICNSFLPSFFFNSTCDRFLVSAVFRLRTLSFYDKVDCIGGHMRVVWDKVHTLTANHNRFIWLMSSIYKSCLPGGCHSSAVTSNRFLISAVLWLRTLSIMTE